MRSHWSGRTLKIVACTQASIKYQLRKGNLMKRMKMFFSIVGGLLLTSSVTLDTFEYLIDLEEGATKNGTLDI
jgi:hypothetical protein